MKKPIFDIIQFVEKYFENKKDKGGSNYMNHLYTVAGQAEKYALSLKVETPYIVYCAGLLHDIIEDTDCTISTLIENGIDDTELLNAIEAITRKPEEKFYIDFIKRVSQNKIARIVKIADLENNMDIRRLNKFGEYEMKRLKKYWYSWKYLRGDISLETLEKEIKEYK